jgi:hypothetical protein
MRLWTLHPRYLDTQGLLAAWREALLAQAVLQGKTRGYTRHPQLARFRAHPAPEAAIAAFLAGLLEEGLRRGFKFDAGKVPCLPLPGQLPETEGQLLYEWARLKEKLRGRSPEAYRRIAGLDWPEAHPLFTIIPGGIQPWEKVPE